MPTEHIKYDDVLREGTDKLNKAIDQANKAEVDSEEALTTANQALQNSESTQTQLDTIVIEGDSSVEAAQARVDADGNAYTTLKERLDTEHTEVTSQLAENMKKTPWISSSQFERIAPENSDSARLQRAIDSIEEGGVLFIEPIEHVITTTIVIDKPVKIQGVYGGHEDNAQVFKGSVLKLADNANTSIMRVVYAGSYTDNRANVIIENVVFNGNKANNTAGHGLIIEGSRYVKVRGCFFARFAEDGINIISDSEGTTSNVLWINENHIIYCDGNGIDFSGGDSEFFNNHTAFCKNGFQISGSTSLFEGNHSWHNTQFGMYVSGRDNNFVGNRTYDNARAGLLISATSKIEVVGHASHSNGTDTGLASTDRAGILVTGVCTDINIASATTGNVETKIFQLYGVSVKESDSTVSLGTISGNDENAFLYTPSTHNVTLHGDTGGKTLNHPGFKALGDIDMNSKYVKTVGFLGLTPVSSSVVPNNAFFVHSSDNVLKFKDNSGTIKVVNMT